MKVERKDAALGEPVPQQGMNRTSTTLILLLTLPLWLLVACRNPTNFKCDPVAGTDCDGGAEATGGGGGDAGGGASTLTVSAKKTLNPLSIDGRPSESVWDLSESISRPTGGTNNNTSTFGVLWDDTYLYVAAKVLDSDLQNDSEFAWFDDSFEVYVDGQGERAASYDGNDLHLIKGWNDPALAAFPSKGATGVLHATADIPGGYTVEMAIPWSNFGVTPAAEKLLGIDVQQNDDDTGADGGGGDREGTVSWNAAQDTNFQSTAGFGFLRLSSEAIGDGGVQSIACTSSVPMPEVQLHVEPAPDICATLGCDAHARCVVRAGAYVCRCNPGWTGDGAHCSDVDECALGTHGCGTRACANLDGSFRCGPAPVPSLVDHAFSVDIDASRVAPFSEIGASHVVTTGVGSYREFGSAKEDRVFYPFEAARPGDLLRLTIRVPDDKPRLFSITVQADTNISWGNTVVTSGVFTGITHAVTGRMIEQSYYFYHPNGAGRFGLTFMNQAVFGPGALASLRVDRVAMDPVAWPLEMLRPNRRKLGIYREDVGFFGGALGVFPAMTDATYAVALERYVSYLERIGSRVLMFPEVWYKGTYSGPERIPAGRIGTELPEHFPETFDQVMARRLSRAGIEYWPTIWNWDLPSLGPWIRSESDVTSGAAAEYVNTVSSSGRVRVNTRWHEPPVLNALHPRVQDAYKSLFRWIMGRVGSEASFSGIVLWSIISSGTGLGSIDQSFDDYSVRTFASERGLALPSITGATRFQGWYQWLKAEHWQEWLSWRKARLTKFYSELAAIITSAKSGAKLNLMVVYPIPTMFAGTQVDDVGAYLDGIGIDVDALSADPNIVVSRQWFDGWYPYAAGYSPLGSPTHTSLLDRLRLDFDRTWQAPFLGRARDGVVHYMYWEQHIFGCPTSGPCTPDSPALAFPPGYAQHEWDWIVPMEHASDRNALRYLIKALELTDARRLEHGGAHLAVQGMEDLLQPLSATFGSLPELSFATVGAVDGIILRSIVSEGSRWFYAVNGTESSKRLSFTLPFGGTWQFLGLDPRTMDYVAGRVVNLDLSGYDLVAWKIPCAN